MLKFVYCVRRHPNVSPEEFHKYWLEKHGRLVSSYANALNAKRYVQSHTIDTPLNDLARRPRGAAEPYDGITEIWWRNADDLIAAMQTPEGQQANLALAKDEGCFVDLSRSSVFFAEEHTIFEHQ